MTPVNKPEDDEAAVTPVITSPVEEKIDVEESKAATSEEKDVASNPVVTSPIEEKNDVENSEAATSGDKDVASNLVVTSGEKTDVEETTSQKDVALNPVVISSVEEKTDVEENMTATCQEKDVASNPVVTSPIEEKTDVEESKAATSQGKDIASNFEITSPVEGQTAVEESKATTSQEKDIASNFVKLSFKIASTDQVEVILEPLEGSKRKIARGTSLQKRKTEIVRSMSPRRTEVVRAMSPRKTEVGRSMSPRMTIGRPMSPRKTEVIRPTSPHDGTAGTKTADEQRNMEAKPVEEEGSVEPKSVEQESIVDPKDVDKPSTVGAEQVEKQSGIAAQHMEKHEKSFGTQLDYQEMTPKPFLGGYFNKRTGVKYLNAAQQAKEKSKEATPVEMFTRQTQLSLLRNQRCNTIREACTQMDRRDLVLDWSYDYIRIPGRYVDSIEWEERRRLASIVIQKCVRRWIAHRNARRLRKYMQMRKTFFEEQEKKQKVELEQTLKRDFERRLNPRKPTDFGILYAELEAWYLQELNKINSRQLDHAERVNALKELLFKELKLLEAIEKLKKIAAKENHKECLNKIMLKMCAPKIWELSNGKVVHVRTPGTTRASDLMHLYLALEKDYASVDERMGVLGYVKWTVQEFDFPLAKEILGLIEREADLMYRNRPAKSLIGLRKRILALFLQFIQTPRFNPEAAAYQHLHTDFDFGPRQSLLRKNSPVEFAH